MGIFSGLFRSRDKPKDSYDSPSYSYFFGRTHAGKRVNDRTAMQIIAVYACVRVLSEAIAQLPLHVYQYTDKGKERVPNANAPSPLSCGHLPTPWGVSRFFCCTISRIQK